RHAVLISDWGRQAANENKCPARAYAEKWAKKTTPEGGCTLCKDWIGVERNHTVLLLYVFVFILSISAYILFLKRFHDGWM
ncbi:hypothetical protein, partial [Cohnella sp.]|uniref:hypothetical protein n=1 Tax=Cohnella sp. TaxID=1883426 RepID=UPI0037048E87